MKSAISVENLGKSYRVSHQSSRPRYRTLRDSLAAIACAPLQSLRRVGDSGSTEEFWALHDVSFEIKPGEVVGIIGRNGAGKSTLLKILSRITKPTCGQIGVHGRVGSLLEVGTGFHPELTGRENVFLNGSILGMSRHEITRRFDEIVDFSGVERFLDTPVKRYSSGMQVRLAFAVAAHLEPEILVVDEVLAVGDIDFQNKCLSRMQDVTKEGRTVLFVSHNMTAVQSLCSRAILLTRGSVEASGPVTEVVSRFLASVASGSRTGPDARVRLSDHPNRRASSRCILQELELRSDGAPAAELPIGASLTCDIHYELPQESPALSFVVFLCKADGQRLLMSHSRIDSQLEVTNARSGRIKAVVNELSLLPGTYRVDLAVVSTDEIYDYIEHATDIDVLASDYLGTGELPNDAQAVFAAKTSWCLFSTDIR